MKRESPADVDIVGAGQAGMTAAHHLCDRDMVAVGRPRGRERFLRLEG